MDYYLEECLNNQVPGKYLFPFLWMHGEEQSILKEEIEALGLKVDRVHTYDTVCGDMKNRKAFEEVDYVLFTSPSTVYNMINVFGKEEIGRKILIAIGGQTAKALKANDLHCYTCKKHSEEGFLEEIIGIKEEYHV